MFSQPSLNTLIGVSVSAFFMLSGAHASDAFFDLEHFSGSGNCGLCHDGLFDGDGNDVSIRHQWSATMMANASRDPFWQAKFASELHRNPSITAVLEDKCTRCHAPMANQQALFDDAPAAFFGDGFIDAQSPYHDAAMDGVSCTLCHQIADDATLGTADGQSGQFVIADVENLYERPAYGPYPSPRLNPMLVNSGFTPTYSPHASESELCATCHNLRTPVLDDEGEVLEGREFAEQAVYSEWEQSAFADGGAEESSCQHCHMARANGVKLANRPRNLVPRDGFARHGFYGGNTLMLDVLSANRAALDVGDGDFDAAIEATRETLRSAADVAIEQASLEDGELDFKVRVSNHTGHKFPTSFPSRRAYLHVIVTDADGKVLFESGALNPDGSIVGVDADQGSGFEPHYAGVIDNGPEQVQVYESIMGTHLGELTYTLLRAAGYLKDNRIPPRGFKKAVADLPADVAVVGAALGDTDFDDGSDLVSYAAKVGDARGVTIMVELKYQTLARGFLRDLMQDDEIDEVAAFVEMVEASDILAETVSAATMALGDVDPDNRGTEPDGNGSDERAGGEPRRRGGRMFRGG